MERFRHGILLKRNGFTVYAGKGFYLYCCRIFIHEDICRYILIIVRTRPEVIKKFRKPPNSRPARRQPEGNTQARFSKKKSCIGKNIASSTISVVDFLLSSNSF